MQTPKFEEIGVLNFDLGMRDFNNMQHTKISGIPLKESKYYDNQATTLHICFAKYENKFGFGYHLSNNYRIFDDHVEMKFEYVSIKELFKAIKSFGGTLIVSNFTNSKTMIKSLNKTFDKNQQGFLPIF
jgi:hypothetical protein